MLSENEYVSKKLNQQTKMIIDIPKAYDMIYKNLIYYRNLSKLSLT